MTDTHGLVIAGGNVVDGSGAPSRRLDVGITDGLISGLGHGLKGAIVIDATGLTVAPGFIDVHTHYDAQVFWDPALTPSCWHGVTTVVAGNCGFSITPCRPEDRELLAHTLEHVEDMPIESLRAGIPWTFETYPQYLDAVEQLGTLLTSGATSGTLRCACGSWAAKSPTTAPPRILRWPRCAGWLLRRCGRAL